MSCKCHYYNLIIHPGVVVFFYSHVSNSCRDVLLNPFQIFILRTERIIPHVYIYMPIYHIIKHTVQIQKKCNSTFYRLSTIVDARCLLLIKIRKSGKNHQSHHMLTLMHQGCTVGISPYADDIRF